LEEWSEKGPEDDQKSGLKDDLKIGSQGCLARLLEMDPSFFDGRVVWAALVASKSL
jgi:hypothetical protein